MGEILSVEEAHEQLEKRLLIKYSQEFQNTSQSKNIKSFVAIVSKKWLDNICNGEITPDLEAYNIDLIEVYQSMFNFPKNSSLSKVIIHVLKKDVSLLRRKEDYGFTTGESIASLLNDYYKKCQKLKHDTEHIYETLKWEDLLTLLSKDKSQLAIPELQQLSPILCFYEKEDYIYIVERFSKFHLLDALKYTPALTENSFTSIFFVIYQITRIFVSFKKAAFKISSKTTLSDFSLHYNSLWLTLSPFNTISQYTQKPPDKAHKKLIEIYNGENTNLRNITLTHTLSDYTQAWCNREISNFDYIFILNKLSGRHFGESLNHPVYPWVTDFSSKNGGLRDLTKTKFRLNKGDHQLDATYNAGAMMLGLDDRTMPVKHHISDVLSDITYYIYNARQTNKETLCKHVRPRWVPNEYPTSIERIYEWTPDECIPEFFYEPKIFKSIHPDLKSLGLPDFINSPESFVKYHYDFLESNAVSEKLHHWIDLIFGYLLEGVHAKENKNVHLSLVDNHKYLRNYGVIKLFSSPHPKRKVLKEDITQTRDIDTFKESDMMLSWEYVDFTSSIKASKENVEANSEVDGVKNSEVNKEDTTDFLSEKIDIPDFNVLDVTTEAESLLNHELSISQITKFGIGKFSFSNPTENLFQQVIDKSEEHDNDFKLYFCLLVEVVLFKSLLTQTYVPSLSQRFERDKQFLISNNSIPRWLKTALLSLVSTEDCDPNVFSTIHSMNSGLNFPTSYPVLFNFLGLLYEAVNISQSYTDNISEKYEKISKQVKLACDILPDLFESLDSEGKNTLLTYLIPLFEDKEIQLYMFLYAFPLLTKVLKTKTCVETFVHILQDIYDHIKPNDDVILLQQNFLSTAIASFGQSSFLKQLLSFVLDTLLKIIEISTEQKTLYSRVCSRSTSVSHDLVVKNDSFVSYEVSAYFGDNDSLCSLNLEKMFHDSSSIQSDQMSNYSSNKEDHFQNNIEREFSGSFIEIDQTEAESSTTADTVFSSQEIHDESADCLIDINKTEIASLTCYFDSSSVEKPFSPINEKSSFSESGFGDSSKELNKAIHSLMSPQEEVQLNIHEAVVETVKWLIPSLGPNLATKHIAEPLLVRLGRMFLSCDEDTGNEVDMFLQHISPTIKCLVEMVMIYGDNIVIYLYLNHTTKIIENGHNASSISISMGSNLVAFTQLMNESCKLMTAETIQMYFEMFSEVFFQPLIRLLSSLKPFSVSVTVRQFLSHKLIDILGMLCQNVNREFAQQMAGSLIQQFFSCFDGIYSLQRNEEGGCEIIRKHSFLSGFDDEKKSSKRGRPKSNNYSSKDSRIEFKSPSRTELFNKPLERGTGSKLSIDDILENDQVEYAVADQHQSVIYDTFSPSLACHAYVLLSRVLGNHYLDNILYNNELVWQLCAKHDEGLASMEGADGAGNDRTSSFRAIKVKSVCSTEEKVTTNQKDENTSPSFQRLEGNWLEYWKSNIGSEKGFHFSDVRLQAYAGHFSGIRDFYVPDNEHYFLSASRDKTVKLWLLKNHGNGTANLGYARTYDNHKRAVFTVQGVESHRWVVSCDGTACVWDPITGQTMCQYEAERGNTMTSLCTLPQPSTCIAVASTEGNLRLYDVRQKKYAQDWKLSPQASVGMVRSLCVNSTGSWIAAGFSTGIVSVLDLKVGLLRGQGKVHDGEILQMLSLPNMGFVSSSTDNNLRLWNEDGSISHIRKTTNESLHSVSNVDQTMMCGSSANKISFYNISDLISPSIYRISEQTLKGNLTKMAVLPLNQLYLFGTDNGNVVLSA